MFDKTLSHATIRELFEAFRHMTKDESIEVEGVVEESYPGSQFLIRLTTEGFDDHKIKARLSGKMRMHYIRIIPGDKVQLKMSPYNLDEGLITYRFRA